MSKVSLTPLLHAFSKSKKTVASRCEICLKKLSSGYVCIGLFFIFNFKVVIFEVKIIFYSMKGCSMVVHKKCISDLTEECSRSVSKLKSTKSNPIKSSNTKRFDISNLQHEIEDEEEEETGKKNETKPRVSLIGHKMDLYKEKSSSFSRIDYLKGDQQKPISSLGHSANLSPNSNSHSSIERVKSQNTRPLLDDGSYYYYYYLLS